MKFGQHLIEHQFQPWKNEYIQYNELKYFLKSRQTTKGWTPQDEHYFTESMLVAELDKVNGFIYLKMKQITGPDAKQRMADLIQFIQLNDVGFYKILKKHDKWTNTSLLSSVRFRDIHQQFQSIIQQLNVMNSKVIEAPLDRAATTAITATKYWVHADHLTELQAILMFHLSPTSLGLINTVYFDDPVQFTLYSNLLERNPDAEMIRARWYGATNNHADIYFEQKLHHESWIDNKGLSTKSRCRLLTNQVDQYLATGDGGDETSQRIFNSIQKNRLKSILRSYHHRTTYNTPENDVYLLLDKNVTFLKEEPSQPSWRRNDVGDDYPFSHLPEDQVHVFPYAVLEVKLKGETTETPAWLTDLIEKGQLLYEVPYFSKFLHGTCHFYRDNLPLLPWWLSEMDLDIRRKSSYATLQSQSSSLGECILIEPPLMPDYLSVPGTAYHRVSKVSSTVNSNNASTVYDDSHIHLTNSTMPTQVPPPKPNAYDMFLNSDIARKLNVLKNYRAEQENHDDNYVSMMAWLYAKVTNNKQVLLSPQYAEPSTQHQQIMPKSGKLKKKVEPKIFFANERTFISWLQFSALLLAVSLGLLNFGDPISKACGGFFIVLAMVLAGYSQLRFQYRAWQIRFRGDSRFDDTIGPAILCIVLVIALFVNLALRIHQPLPENPSLFGSPETDLSTNHSLINKTTTHVVNGTSIVKNHRYANGTKVDKKGRTASHDEDDDDDEA